VRVHTVPFDIRADHDLLEYAHMLGLQSGTDMGRGHFPGLSNEPLGVSQAKQSIVAQFSATGFRAAAETHIVIALRNHPRRPASILVTFDRPFGFLAVHRPTKLVLVAGLVYDVRDFSFDGQTDPD
jgi:serine protease inhibitor